MIRFLASSLCSSLLLLPALAHAQATALPDFSAQVISAQVGPAPAPGQHPDELRAQKGTIGLGEIVGIDPNNAVQHGLMLRNIGQAASGPVTYEIWLSADNDREINPNDRFIYRGVTGPMGICPANNQNCGIDIWMPRDGAGVFARYTPQFKIPQDLNVANPPPPPPPGQPELVNGYVGFEPYIKVLIDPDDEITERSEANNVYIGTGKIRIGLPNLRPHDVNNSVVVDLPDAGCFFGQPVDLSYRVCNNGLRPATGFVNTIVLSTDDTFTIAVHGGDTRIDEFPRSCRGFDNECGENGFCAFGTCHQRCSESSECEEGLVCTADALVPYTNGPTCQNQVGFNMTSTPVCENFTRTVTLPTVDNLGQRFPEDGQLYYIGALINVKNNDKIPEYEPRDNTTYPQADGIECRYPRPDVQPTELVAPPRVAAGETATIVRTLRNVGIVPADVGYRYVLSTNDVASHDDINLLLEGRQGDGSATVPSEGSHQGADLVRIPPTVVAGTYYLGIIVDGFGLVDELDENNNTLIAATRVEVEPSALRVLTRSLPDATLGTNYSQHLVAAGGVATYQWSADMLPQGFTLSASGALTGTPREPGSYAFTVRVSSGDVYMDAMLAIRVQKPMGALAITTDSLPPAVVGKEYFAHIAAQGGEPGTTGYTCTTGDSLPDVLSLNPNCTITGKPLDVTSTPRTFTVELRDSLGNRAVKDLSIVVVGSSTLVITTDRLPEGNAGMSYEGRITASGGTDGSYQWTLEESDRYRRPLGTDLSVVPVGAATATLSGEPRECGTFLVPVRVTSGQQSTSAIIPLNVLCAKVSLANLALPSLKHGESIDHQLALNAGEGAWVRVFAGQLPAGITLSEAGLFAGTVATEAQVGTYNFVVQLQDDSGGHALVGLSIEVLPTIKEIKPIPNKDEGNCSTAGNGVSSALPFAVVLLGLVAAAFRRRVAAFARLSSFVAVLALAGAAQAQASYRVSAPLVTPYEDLGVGATRASGILSDADFSGSGHMWRLPFPSGATFRFFGETYGHLGVSGSGGIIPYSVAQPGTAAAFYVDETNDPLPTAGGPAGIIAPWWDDFVRNSSASPAGGLYYKVDTEGGKRVLKVQWKNLSHYDCSTSSISSRRACNQAKTYSFQAWIYEADAGNDSTIVFLYDEPRGAGGVPGAGYSTTYAGTLESYKPSGSVGLENVAETRGVTALACTPNCTFDVDFPAGRSIVMTQKPDLRAASFSGDLRGWAGVRTSVRGEVENIGKGASGPFAVQFFGSTDAVLDAGDTYLGSSGPLASIDADRKTSFASEVTLPVHLQPGSYYVIARVDGLNEVDEDFRGNNVLVHGPFVIAGATPDPAVESIDVPASAAIGSTFTLEWTVRNFGNAPAIGVPYDVVVSDNEVISPTDRKIGSGVLDVDLLSVGPESVEVTIPSDVRPGSYFIGIIIDPADELAEVSDLNNATASAVPFVAVGGKLQLVSTVLTTAEAGVDYCVRLAAAGGNGDYAWSVANGSALPPGLTLVRETSGTTLLCGVPSQPGAYSFSLQLTSGAETISGAVTLAVTASGAPLTVASAELPGGTFNAPYAATLVAVGGQAPYAWTLLSGTLPNGLGLTGGGAITGAPAEAGTFSFTVQVRDATGEVADQALSLIVYQPGRLSCMTSTLPTVVVGDAIDGALSAAGGSAPYSWTAIETRRLSKGTDPGAELEVPAPPGVLLARDGRVSGTPTAVGTYVWTVEVQDVRSSERCIVLLDVVTEQGLVVATRSLADAIVAVPYEAQLDATGGDGFRRWSLVQGSTLPSGLELSESGVISGRLYEDALGGKESRTFSFVVEVRDGLNRSGLAGLSIALRHPAPPVEDGGNGEDGGCQTGAGAPGMFGVALALGLVALRRRS